MTVHSNKIQKEQVTKVEQVLVQICKEEQNKNLSKAATMEEREAVQLLLLPSNLQFHHYKELVRLATIATRLAITWRTIFNL